MLRYVFPCVYSVLDSLSFLDWCLFSFMNLGNSQWLSLDISSTPFSLPSSGTSVTGMVDHLSLSHTSCLVWGLPNSLSAFTLYVIV